MWFTSQRSSRADLSLAKTSASSWAETDLTTLFDAQSAVLEESDTKGPVSIAVAVAADLKQLGMGEGEARLVVFGTAAFADNKNINPARWGIHGVGVEHGRGLM